MTRKCTRHCHHTTCTTSGGLVKPHWWSLFLLALVWLSTALNTVTKYTDDLSIYIHTPKRLITQHSSNSHITNNICYLWHCILHLQCRGQRYTSSAFVYVPSCLLVNISKREFRCQGHVSIANVVEDNNRPSRIIWPLTDSILLLLNASYLKSVKHVTMLTNASKI